MKCKLDDLVSSRKSRIRIKPGQKFGVVEKVHFDAKYNLWSCGCGSYRWELLEGGVVKCAECYRVTDHTWNEGRRG